MRLGYSRLSVYRPDWDRILKVFENIGSCDVTRRKLILGARNSTTRWRTKTWIESPVKAVFIPRASSGLALKVGTYVRTDALVLTAAGFEEGWEVKTADGKYWEVKAVRENFAAGTDSFSHRELDLTLMPFHFLDD